MKIKYFEINDDLIKNNLIEFANASKYLLYNENPALLEKLDIENDDIFLEPMLLYYFKAKEINQPFYSLDQILLGYLNNEKNQKKIRVKSDLNGIINLPNFGYIEYKPNEDVEIIISQSLEKCNILKENIEFEIKKHSKLDNSQIKILNYECGLLKNGTTYNNSIIKTVRDNAKTLNKSWLILNEIYPEYCNLIRATTKDVSIFDSSNNYSQAALSSFGTAFINLYKNVQNEIFFIDDLAHQCGHVLFYTLSRPTTEYFKVSANTSLKNFTHIDWEERDVYGGFHGLFTYSTILSSLEKLLQYQEPKSDYKIEIIARIVFYLSKFSKDISIMNDSRILSKEGWRYYDMFKENYDFYYNEYKIYLHTFDFSNQEYQFNLEKFKKINSNELYS